MNSFLRLVNNRNFQPFLFITYGNKNVKPERIIFFAKSIRKHPKDEKYAGNPAETRILTKISV
jgi:hypothetical protein